MLSCNHKCSFIDINKLCNKLLSLSCTRFIIIVIVILQQHIYACSSGSYAYNVYGTIYCFDCDAGYYCPDGVNIIECPAGQYTPTSSYSTCLTCPAGTTSSLANGGKTYCYGLPTVEPIRPPTSQPSRQPSGQPSRQPSRRPTSQPTQQPTSKPSRQPYSKPTTQPSKQPKSSPTVQPSGKPSRKPSNQPTSQPTSHPSRNPSSQPTMQPITHPSGQPSSQPTEHPVIKPSAQPSSEPSSQPSSQPSCQPTRLPTRQPTGQPSAQPFAHPSSRPSSQPTVQPNAKPSSHPSILPSSQPSCQPSRSPTRQPIGQPTAQPIALPSRQPTSQPTAHPTTKPSSHPSIQPSTQPSSQPSKHPSCQPSCLPTCQPTGEPTTQPRTRPTAQPTVYPSSTPSSSPSRQPTTRPTYRPVSQPSSQPSLEPSAQPIGYPSQQPTTQPSFYPTHRPSSCPSNQPTGQPSNQPTGNPSMQSTSKPTTDPTTLPSIWPTTQPSRNPSSNPTTNPTGHPSSLPSTQPSSNPTEKPSNQPSSKPSVQPSLQPSSQPSEQPSSQSSSQPSMQPTDEPNAVPTNAPSFQPTVKPSSQPSKQPKIPPTTIPSSYPSLQPKSKPTNYLTTQPSPEPSKQPSNKPSSQPSSQPTCHPTGQPTVQPSIQPTCLPSRQPSILPSSQPTTQPSSIPTTQPTTQPTHSPSSTPSRDPTNIPSSQPTVAPRVFPSSQPTSQPTVQSSAQPSEQPSSNPSTKPSGNPSVQPTSKPYSMPTTLPTTLPTTQPSVNPSVQPNGLPTLLPSMHPTCYPSSPPTKIPQPHPSTLPSLIPTDRPTHAPPLSISKMPNTQPSLLHKELSLQSITFTNDGTAVIFKLSTSVVTTDNQFKSYFPCNMVVVPVSSSANCLFMDSTTIKATNAALFELRTPIKLVLDTPLRAMCRENTPCVYTTINSTEFRIAPGDNPITPLVQVKVPQVVGMCNNLIIDLTASTGNAGKNWQSMEIRLKTGVDVPAINASYIQTILMSKITTASAFSMDRSLLVASAYPYEFEITLCNIFSKCDSRVIAVNVTTESQIPPTAQILGAYHRHIVRSVSLSLMGEVSSIGCSGINTGVKVSGAANLRVSWQIWLQSIDQSQPEILQESLLSTSRDVLKFSLPPYSLEASRTYRIALIAFDPKSNQIGSTSTFVSITEAPPVVVMNPRVREQQIRIGVDTLSLDASLSYDPDVDPKVSSQQTRLEFTWYCVAISDITQLVDVTPLQNQASMNCPLNMTVSGPVATVSPFNESFIGTYAALILEFKSTKLMESYHTVKNTTYTIKFKLIAGDAPRVVIKSPSSDKINPKSRLTLTGVIQTNLACTAQWSSQDSFDGRDLMSIASSTLQKLVPAGTKRETTFNLALPSYSLPRQETSLTFTLVCGRGSASVTIYTNGPPTGGIFGATPSEGKEMLTDFTMSNYKWIDVDLPLKYQYGYLVKSEATQFLQLIVRTPVEVSYMTSELPAGDSRFNSLLNVTTNVFDSLDASSFASVTVIVAVIPIEDLQSIIMKSLSATGNSSQLTMTMQEMQQFVAVSSTALNRVNCSAAPSCVALNRYPCSSKDNTCGLCKDGFIGEPSDSNSYCASSVDILTMKTSNSITNSNQIEKEVICLNNTDCFPWQTCEVGEFISEKVCRERQKTCPGDCSGHGSCKFYSTSTDIELSSDAACTVFMTTCTSSCVCFSGYAGSQCSVTQEELNAKALVREGLLMSLSQIVQTVDFDEASTVSTASTLQSILSARDEISPTTVVVATTVAKQVMAQAMTLSSLSFQDLLPILEATDAALSAERKLIQYTSQQTHPIATFTDVLSSSVDVISAFGRLIFNEQIMGGNISNFLYDNFRLSSYPNTKLSTPLDSLEKLDNRTATATLRAITSDSYNADNKTRQLQVIEIPKSFWKISSVHNETLESNIVSIQTANVPTITLAMQTDSKKMSTVRILKRYNLTTYCRREDVGNYSMTCTDSGVIVYNACKGREGIMTAYCPPPKLGCLSLALETRSAKEQQNCEVLHSSDQTVTCRCNVPKRSINRRLNIDNTMEDVLYESGALTVGLMVYYIATDFESSFSASSHALSSVEDTERVAIVISMFSVIWALGCLVLGILLLKRRQITKQHGNRIQAKINHKKQKARSTAIIGNLLIDNNASDETSRFDALRDRLVTYFNSAIPHVFDESSSIFSCIKMELLKHHSYLRVVFSTKTDRLLILEVCQLLTIQSLMMFLIAVLYDLQGPDDDGSCSQYMTESDCLNRKSLFDSSQTYCKWASDNTAIVDTILQPICVYNAIDVTFEVGLYCAIVASCFTGLIMRPVDYLFANLSAETQDSSKKVLRSGNGKHHRKHTFLNTARRNSIVVLKSLEDSVINSTLAFVEATKFIPEETKAAHNEARLSMIMLSNHKSKVRNELPEPLTAVRRSTEETIFGDPAIAARVLPPQQEFSTLEKQVFQTRSRLCALSCDNNEILAFFDKSWGIDSSTGLFRTIQHKPAMEDHDAYGVLHTTELKPFHGGKQILPISQASTKLRNPHHHKSLSVAEVIQIEMNHTYSRLENAFTTIRGLSDDAIGVEILQYFMQDVLGGNTPMAKLFRTKINEDYNTTLLVPFLHQIGSGILLVLLNIFFVYYSILRGYQKGIHWQRSFLLACLIQMFTDIFIYQTIECIYVNVFLPKLISKDDIRLLKETLNTCVKELCDPSTLLVDSDKHDSSINSDIVNAPDYFFVSTMLAKIYPHLMESMMIQSYHSCLPGKISEHWRPIISTRSTTQRYYSQPPLERNHLSLYNSRWIQDGLMLISTLLSFLLIQSLTLIPLELQKMLLRFFEPLLLSALASLWLAMKSSGLSISIIIPMIIVVVVSVLALLWWRNKVMISNGMLSNDNQTNNQTDTIAIDHSTTVVIERLVREELRIDCKNNGNQSNASSDEFELSTPSDDINISEDDGASCDSSIWNDIIYKDCDTSYSNDVDFWLSSEDESNNANTLDSILIETSINESFPSHVEDEE